MVVPFSPEQQPVVDLAPASTEAKLRLGEVYMVLRDYSKAMELVNEALRIDPNAARGYFLKGYIHMETKDTSRAISSFRTPGRVSRKARRMRSVSRSRLSTLGGRAPSTRAASPIQR